MKKMKDVELRTGDYSFTVEVCEDTGGGGFVAKLGGQKPAIPQEGDGGVVAQYVEEEELWDANVETLMERCRARINEIDGEIISEREL